MQALVKACDSAKFPAEVALVLSNKLDAEGLKFAKEKSIKTAIVSHKDFILEPEDKEKSRENFDKKVSEEVEKSGAQIICLAGFMRLLSPWFVQRWFDRLINIHPSLLPEFKGADAVGDAVDDVYIAFLECFIGLVFGLDLAFDLFIFLDLCLDTTLLFVLVGILK